MANKVAYSSLYQMVVNEIESRTTYSQKKNYSSQLTRPDIAPLAGNAISDITSAAIINSVQTLLSQIIKPRIIRGLNVVATSPSSNKVIVKQGSGVSYGRYYELRDDVEITIPFDSSTEIYYLVLFDNGIMIDKTDDFEKLTVAKIIVPRPGTTNYVIDDREDNSIDAYIVNQRDYDLKGDIDGYFEEDTLELLRDNISPILADNLIGNIRLTEDLKILNTSGTLELNSQELKVYDTSGNTLMRLNRNGTYFYDTVGREIAKFASDGAKVGNINIDKNRLRSGNFVSESKGFEIRDDGYAEFQDVRVRGRISSSVFEYDKVSAVGGKLIVGNSTVLADDISATDTTITLQDNVFNIGDVLIMKDGINEEYMLVTNIDSGSSTITVTRDLANAYVTNPTWNTGTAIVSTGNSESGALGGFIVFDAVSAYSPFIDINSRNSGTYNDYTTKVRLGNLEGINDALYGALSGYGLYSDNVYLRGKLYAPDIKTAVSGSRITLDTEALRAYDDSDNIIFQLMADGADTGDVLIGQDPRESGAQGIYWDNSTGVLCIGGCIDVAGSISASCVTAGTLCLSQGITIESNPLESGTSGCTIFNSAGISSYNCHGQRRFCVSDGHIEAQDIKLQDPNCNCCYSYLDAGALKFHDECGDVPYVKRICSGEVNTGDTVYLAGWKTTPKVLVSIKSLYSYNATYNAQDQQWDVYADNITSYVDSGGNYGYQFDAHASLRLAEGVGAQVLKEVSFGNTVCTDACTCATCVRMRFQLWCNNAAPSNYYYGVLCYALCYRKLGDVTWCACCYCYEQPHTNTTELKTTQDETRCLIFPCMQVWEIQPNQVSLNWTDATICASTTQCCLCCVSLPIPSINKAIMFCMCAYDCANYCDFTWFYCTCDVYTDSTCLISPITTAYCAYVCASIQGCLRNYYCVDYSYITCYGGCYNICSEVDYRVKVAGTTVRIDCNAITSSGVYNCNPSCNNPPARCGCCDYSGAESFCANLDAYATCCFCGIRSCEYQRIGIYEFNNTSMWCNVLNHRGCSCICTNIVSATLYRCYCVFVGDAACCDFKCTHSLCDTYGCSCILDPNGVLNFIAIAYT
jgi:hypothetical protein